MTTKKAPTPSRFKGVVLDPPWPENGGGKIKRGADRHFKTLTPKKILAAIQESGAFRPAEHCHVYMWITNNHLRNGLWLFDQLGVRYITQVTWPKQRSGLGQYFRGKTEHVLFGVIGKGKDPSVYTDAKNLSTLLEQAEHSRIHSRKPEAFFHLVEARTKGPYLEMFCDHELPPRKNWYRWGLPRYSDSERAAHAEEREHNRVQAEAKPRKRTPHRVGAIATGE